MTHPSPCDNLVHIHPIQRLLLQVPHKQILSRGEKGRCAPVGRICFSGINNKEGQEYVFPGNDEIHISLNESLPFVVEQIVKNKDDNFFESPFKGCPSFEKTSGGLVLCFLYAGSIDEVVEKYRKEREGK